jgi:hypothetical protein
MYSRRAAQEKLNHLIFYLILLNQSCQSSEFLQFSSNYCDGYAKGVFNSERCMMVIYHTADQSTETEPCISYPVTSQILPPKEHEINK